MRTTLRGSPIGPGFLGVIEALAQSHDNVRRGGNTILDPQ